MASDSSTGPDLSSIIKEALLRDQVPDLRKQPEGEDIAKWDRVWKERAQGGLV